MVGRVGAGVWEVLQEAMEGLGLRGAELAAVAVCGGRGMTGPELGAGRAEAAVQGGVAAAAGAST